MPLLEVHGLSVRHAGVLAVDAVDLSVGEGEVVAILGANGSGKSSLLRALLGLCEAESASIDFNGRDMRSLTTRTRLEQGISLVPETRALFPAMTVEDNLKLGLFLKRAETNFTSHWDRVVTLFPGLRNKLRQRAGTLSGGEQQMVAIARALMQEPRLLCLDEPSLGLAPIVVDQLYVALEALRREKVALLLVEQQTRRAVEFANRCYVLRVGKVVASGPAAEIAQSDTVSAYFGGTAI